MKKRLYYLALSALTSLATLTSGPLCAHSSTVPTVLPLRLCGPLYAGTLSSRAYIGYSQSEGTESYDAAGKRTSFLSQYSDTLPVGTLFNGITIDQATQPETYKYFNTSFSGTGTNTSIRNGTNIKATDHDAERVKTTPDSNKYPYKPLDVSLAIDTSSFKTETLTARYTQNLFAGFYIEGALTGTKHHTSATVKLVGADRADSRAIGFLAALDTILKENKCAPLTGSTTTTLCEQIEIAGGWHHRSDQQPGSMIKQIDGDVSVGFITTPDTFSHPTLPYILPHNRTHGITAALRGKASLNKWVACGARLKTTVFLKKTGTAHIVTDDYITQTNATWHSGPLLMGTGVVEKDLGTLWEGAGFVQLENLFGLRIQTGYQFTHQEATTLALKDRTIMKNLIDKPGEQARRLNSDPKLQRWYHHMLFIGIKYTPPFKIPFKPEIAVHGSFPIGGKLSARPNKTIGGSCGASMSWIF